MNYPVNNKIARFGGAVISLWVSSAVASMMILAPGHYFESMVIVLNPVCGADTSLVELIGVWLVSCVSRFGLLALPTGFGSTLTGSVFFFWYWWFNEFLREYLRR